MLPDPDIFLEDDEPALPFEPAYLDFEGELLATVCREFNDVIESTEAA